MFTRLTDLLLVIGVAVALLFSGLVSDVAAGVAFFLAFANQAGVELARSRQPEPPPTPDRVDTGLPEIEEPV